MITLSMDDMTPKDLFDDEKPGDISSESINRTFEEKSFIDSTELPKLSPIVIRTFRYRWIMLTFFTLGMFGNAFLYVSMFAIADVTCRFYGIQKFQVTWSSNAYLFVQAVFMIPCSLLSSRLGIKRTMVIASGLGAIGSCLYLAGMHPTGYYFFITGLAINSLSFTLMMPLAPEISSVWFSESEHALATSIAIYAGPSLGGSIGFLIPATVFRNPSNAQDLGYVQNALQMILGGQSIVAVLLFAFVMLFAREQPYLPPTISQAVKRRNKECLEIRTLRRYFRDVAVLLRNPHYHLAGHAAALSIAIIYYLPVVINPLMSWLYPGQEDVIGWFGVTSIWANLLGAIIIGALVARNRKLKTWALTIAIITVIGWCGVTECFLRVRNLYALFALNFVTRFISCPFGAIVVEMIVEMTYPISSVVPYVTLLTVSRMYTVGFIFASGWLMDRGYYEINLWAIVGTLAVAMLLIAVAKVEYKRSSLDKAGRDEDKIPPASKVRV